MLLKYSERVGSKKFTELTRSCFSRSFRLLPVRPSVATSRRGLRWVPRAPPPRAPPAVLLPERCCCPDPRRAERLRPEHLRLEHRLSAACRQPNYLLHLLLGYSSLPNSLDNLSGISAMRLLLLCSSQAGFSNDCARRPEQLREGACMFINLDFPFRHLLSSLLLVLRFVHAFPLTDVWYGGEGDGVPG
jgi:hypothetical protein